MNGVPRQRDRGFAPFVLCHAFVSGAARGVPGGLLDLFGLEVAARDRSISNITVFVSCVRLVLLTSHTRYSRAYTVLQTETRQTETAFLAHSCA